MLIACRCGCGKQFEPYPKQQQYFSAACRQKRTRGNRWQVCSIGCETVRAKMYLPSPKAAQGQCARCGKVFKKPCLKSKYCSVECRCKMQNKLSTEARKVELKELTVFRKRLKDSHYEFAKDDPSPTARAARVRYLTQFYANDENGARMGLQRT
jgi:hypothetical protein